MHFIPFSLSSFRSGPMREEWRIFMLSPPSGPTRKGRNTAASVKASTGAFFPLLSRMGGTGGARCVSRPTPIRSGPPTLFRPSFPPLLLFSPLLSSFFHCSSSLLSLFSPFLFSPLYNHLLLISQFLTVQSTKPNKFLFPSITFFICTQHSRYFLLPDKNN